MCGYLCAANYLEFARRIFSGIFIQTKGYFSYLETQNIEIPQNSTEMA